MFRVERISFQIWFLQRYLKIFFVEFKIETIWSIKLPWSLENTVKTRLF